MWKNPNGATPSIVQTYFGLWGQNMPGDGEAYCAPTSIVMQLYYLAANGFIQLAPAEYDGQTDPDSVAANLERIIAGLCNTTVTEGTTNGLVAWVEAYLSACGISPDQYSATTTPTPSLDWLTTSLAPNVAADPSTISLTVFSVGWFQGVPPNLTNTSGHVLAPLLVQTGKSGPELVLNNAFPASFEVVPNLPTENPQTVQIEAVPSTWNLGLPYPAGDYSQVISGNKGGPKSGQGKGNKSYAILWGGECWQILPSALPTSSGYAPSVWSIGPKSQTLDTNGGVLRVIAPLAGAGGLIKTGLGTVILTAANALTGATIVGRGTLASTATSGTPFGTGRLRIWGGGTLSVAAGGSVAIASGAGSALEIGEGGVLALNGSGSVAVTIGNSASASSLTRLQRGTLLIAPGAGLAELGLSQQATISGSGPPTANGVVAPFILGQDCDAEASGAFLAYGASGFESAVTLSSASVGINAAPADAVYEVVDPQTIAPGRAVKLAALEVDSAGAVGGGAGTSLLVGDQAAGSLAGVILNGGSIASGTLAFGAAEGLIYTSLAGGSIAAAVTGSDVTAFGPGSLTLSGGATLTGGLAINAGALVAAAGATVAAAKLYVHGDAALVAAGSVSGFVSLGNAATLLLDQGTVEGEVTTAYLWAPPAPPAILQGAGTMAGAVTFNGNIVSGAAAGLLTFTGAARLVGAASFFWRLQRLVDNSNGNAGTDWNALVFTSSEITIGRKMTQPPEPLTLYLDFSALGADPDGGDSFWGYKRQWTLINATSGGPEADCCGGNFAYVCGQFFWNQISDQNGAWSIVLYWVPKPSQSLDQRWLEEATTGRGPAE